MKADNSKTSAKKETILSGIQPTGAIHVGNLEGALRNWARLQDDYDMYICIVDWHALTAEYNDTGVLRDYVFQAAVDILAVGLDPNTCAIFVQSEVKEHAELHLIFSMLVTVATLTRLPTYQEKKEELESYGFLGYPVLQAADICLYNAHKVPVGKDQEKHIWLANDLAKRFNRIYGETFVLPEALFTEVPLILGSDRRKMSKSLNNDITVSATEKETEEKIRSFFTDEKKIRKGDPGNPDMCPVYMLHRVYTPDADEEIAPPCRTGELGCVDCKTRLSANLNAELAPLRQKRDELIGNPDYVWDVLRNGSDIARARAQRVMDKVRDNMKTSYRKRP
ncbi:MAG: tryptophan--tRNA ligase [Candidatus Zixiibacteriota bacterium]|nr:MAG: tryptophan--tRNA ligase [candidate division Zixibacteria bacterium]